MADRRVKIGVVGVDSGMLVVCDPCYINHNGKQTELNNYTKLCERMHDSHLQLKYDLGHAGLGVVFSSGLGDGVYEVWATIGNVKGWGERVKKVEVILIDE
jgi:hypothetical protein